MACSVLALFGFALVLIPGMSSLGWLLLNGILILLMLSLLVLLHEMGHAAAAKLMGYRVFRLRIGTGPKLWERRFPRFAVEVRSIPTLSGLTIAAPTSTRWVRLRHLVYGSSGLLANVLVLCAAFALVPPADLLDQLRGPAMEEGLTAVLDTAIASLLILAIVLCPGRAWTVYGKVPTDGLAFLETLLASKSDMEQLLATRYASEGFECRLRGEHQAAREWHEKGLEKHPNDFLNRHNLAVALMDLKEFRAARDHLLDLEKRDDLKPNMRVLLWPVLLNNIAWVDLMIGDRDLLDEARKYSEAAYRDASPHPSVKGTRGSVLVELGQADEGLALLRDALESAEEPSSKALNACYIAVGEKRRGNTDEARLYLDAARALDADCPLLERAAKELAPT